MLHSSDDDERMIILRRKIHKRKCKLELVRIREESKKYLRDNKYTPFFGIYTGDAYANINNYVRGLPYDEEARYIVNDISYDVKDVSAIIKTGMRKPDIPRLQHSVYLFRGTTSDHFLSSEHIDLSFTSMSGNKNTMSSFRGPDDCCYLYIQVPRGAPLLCLESITFMPGEDEFLSLPASRFEVSVAAPIHGIKTFNLILKAPR
jgi:hypothetical protein